MQKLVTSTLFPKLSLLLFLKCERTCKSILKTSHYWTHKAATRHRPHFMCSLLALVRAGRRKRKAGNAVGDTRTRQDPRH